ncbi:hypothetical protein K466DRAFT_466545, partial [Polyporus arcularius HHB13444]
MNFLNASTGYTPFQLRLGLEPRIIPPLLTASADEMAQNFQDDGERARTLIERLETDTMEAQDNLTLAKTTQTMAANEHRGAEVPYAVGDRVLLATFHRRREYMQRGDHRVAK